MFKRLLTLATDKIHGLPVLVLMPHSRCNCRCVMCDIWKANSDKKEITTEELARHINSFKSLGVRHIAFSGGEALMHSNLWKFCELLKSINIKISLLSTGITLKTHAVDVVKHTDDVIVSLDGPRDIHNQIRNLSSAYEKLQAGVKAVKEISPAFKISGRCVLQKLNYKYLFDIILASKALGLDQISFLAADVSTSAFNHNEPWTNEKRVEISLNEEESDEFDHIVQESFVKFSDLYKNKFIAESPSKMKSLSQYYKAILGKASFPVKQCNAPWVSAVIEADGEVRPCFFHRPYGNIFDKLLPEVLNSPSAIQFRKNLNMKKDPICERCVCSLHIGIA
ncbi:MAG TPA: radical SAM protein [Chryseolinea sp.]|nr:radical SAM protein [Chryseolinea sp.]